MPRIRENKCLSCNHSMDGAASPEDENKMPEDGDISICIRCGHVAVFDKDLNFRELTDECMVEIAGYSALLAAQKVKG